MWIVTEFEQKFNDKSLGFTHASTSNAAELATIEIKKYDTIIGYGLPTATRCQWETKTHQRVTNENKTTTNALA